MYSLIDIGGKENKTGKGVKSVVVKNIRHRKYCKGFINKKIMRHIMKRIESKLHKIGTYEVCKISLSCFDNNNYIIDDGLIVWLIFIKIY